MERCFGHSSITQFLCTRYETHSLRLLTNKFHTSMSNICKTVTLRTRKIKKGTQLSFYLDYYPGYRDESTMKVQRHESLGIYIFAKPKNQRERDYNERMTEKAEALRCRRYESIVNERYDFFDREKEKGNFLAWFKKKADTEYLLRQVP